MMRRLILGVLCVSVLAAAPAKAGDAAAEAVALASELMSPFCPGLLLADCRSSGAQELRAEIHDRLGRGESRDAIVNDLVLRFGPHVRAVPTAEGLGLLVWVLPGVLGAATLFMLIWRVLQATRHDPTTESALPSEDPALTVRLDQELWAAD
jgi:cytochrome c-type biogenesis protein CcmH/NrfF